MKAMLYQINFSPLVRQKTESNAKVLEKPPDAEEAGDRRGVVGLVHDHDHIKN